MLTLLKAFNNRDCLKKERRITNICLIVEIISRPLTYKLRPIKTLYSCKSYAWYEQTPLKPKPYFYLKLTFSNNYQKYDFSKLIDTNHCLILLYVSLSIYLYFAGVVKSAKKNFISKGYRQKNFQKKYQRNINQSFADR